MPKKIIPPKNILESEIINKYYDNIKKRIEGCLQIYCKKKYLKWRGPPYMDDADLGNVWRCSICGREYFCGGKKRSPWIGEMINWNWTEKRYEVYLRVLNERKSWYYIIIKQTLWNTRNFFIILKLKIQNKFRKESW